MRLLTDAATRLALVVVERVLRLILLNGNDIDRPGEVRKDDLQQPNDAFGIRLLAPVLSLPNLWRAVADCLPVAVRVWGHVSSLDEGRLRIERGQQADRQLDGGFAFFCRLDRLLVLRTFCQPELRALPKRLLQVGDGRSEVGDFFFQRDLLSLELAVLGLEALDLGLRLVAARHVGRHPLVAIALLRLFRIRVVLQSPHEVLDNGTNLHKVVFGCLDTRGHHGERGASESSTFAGQVAGGPLDDRFAC
mmetsp:Transcript_82493/g.230020  ORF Transcript_82493/g.230020 Transcript_82493/m.230020 type:complete len:249 (-) Transcript_82493:1219-1965(-)